MYESEVLYGKWDELARQDGPELHGRQVEIRILSSVRPNPARMITLGMFPELASLTDADFKAAEWRGPREDEL